LAWQALAVTYSLRGMRLAHEHLNQEHSELYASYMQLLRVGQTLPSIISIIVCYAISTSHHS
jgi:hypothetical protein